MIPARSGRGQVAVVVNSHWGFCGWSHATVGLVFLRWNQGVTHA